MENFNYLGVINGVYYNDEAAQEFNKILQLLVFINKGEDLIKISGKELIFNILCDDDEPQINIKKHEIILEVGPLEGYLIKSNFNNNLIKELILNKIYDYTGDYLVFAEVF